MSTFPKKPFQPLAELPNKSIAPQTNARYSPAKKSIQRITPLSTVSDSWYQSGQATDFELNIFDLDIVENWYLRFGVNWFLTEPDAESETFTLYTNPSPFLIDHLELHVNGNIVETIPNYSLWQEILKYTTLAQAEGSSRWLNYTVSTGNVGTTNSLNGYTSGFPNIGVGLNNIVNVSAAVFYYSIPFKTVLDKCSANWRILSKNNKIKLRIYYNDQRGTWSHGTYNNGNVVPITSARPKMFSLELYASGIKLSHDESRKQESLYMKNGMSAISTCIKTIASPVNQLLAVNDTSTETVLSGIDGTISQLTAFVAIAPEDIASSVIYLVEEPPAIDTVNSTLGRRCVYPASFTLLDQQSNPVFVPTLPSDIEILDTIRGYNDCPFQYLLITYNFNNHPKASIEEGEVSGGVYFKDWRIKFTSGVNVTASLNVPNPSLFCTLYQLCQVTTEAMTGVCKIAKI